MELESYAELAVRLVNTTCSLRPEREDLASLEDLRALLHDYPYMRDCATDSDVAALRVLRNELRDVFAAAERGDEHAAVNGINALLRQYPMCPQISGHDNQDWHLHLTEQDSLVGHYATRAAMGITMVVTQLGIDRLGVCQAHPCRDVFIDTSTNRSRRYCSERCASRANVAAYRARRRARERPDTERSEARLSGQ